MTGVSTKNGVIEKAMVGLVEKHLFLDLVQRLKLEIILRLVDTVGTVDTCFQILRIPHVWQSKFRLCPTSAILDRIRRRDVRGIGSNLCCSVFEVFRHGDICCTGGLPPAAHEGAVMAPIPDVAEGLDCSHVWRVGACCGSG